jgi:hypothetical protein
MGADFFLVVKVEPALRAGFLYLRSPLKPPRSGGFTGERESIKIGVK